MTDTSLQQQDCLNCGNSFAGSFCNKCGQKEAHRITIAHVCHDMVHVFLHADKGIFPFMARLIRQPGTMAREYIEGKRKIFNPFQYLIFSVGLIVFLMTQSNFFESLASINSKRASELPGYFQKAMSDFNWFVKTYSNIITFLTLPIYTLYSWLFFRSKGHNYAEHFTIMVFSMSQINTLNALILISLIIFKVSGLGYVTISMMLIFASFTLTFKQFYGLKWGTSFLKSVVIYISSYATQVMLMGLGLLVYIIIIKSRGQG